MTSLGCPLLRLKILCAYSSVTFPSDSKKVSCPQNAFENLPVMVSGEIVQYGSWPKTSVCTTDQIQNRDLQQVCSCMDGRQNRLGFFFTTTEQCLVCPRKFRSIQLSCFRNFNLLQGDRHHSQVANRCKVWGAEIAAIRTPC